MYMQQSLQHATISETWKKLSFIERMANIGSEVERTLNWQVKNNPKLSQKAFFRALELFDLTLMLLAQEKTYTLSRLTEVARAKELFADHVYGDNQYSCTRESWQKYFKPFNYLARLIKVE